MRRGFRNGSRILSRRRLHCALIAAAALAALAWSRDAKTLERTHPSAEALASAVLEALGRSDRARLQALAVTESEFRERVWPELPAARPERNLPVAYVWGDLAQKSRNSLTQVLQEAGGERYSLRRVSFAGVTEYPTYRIHHEAAFHVAGVGGVERTIRACGSTIETDGGWKVFSYVID